MTRYTVQRCRKNDDLYGSSHASYDAEKTVCGITIDEKWWITNNDGTGEVTCKKCKEVSNR